MTEIETYNYRFICLSGLCLMIKYFTKNSLLNMSKYYVFDLNGVLFTKDTEIEGASALFNKLKESGNKVIVLTNSTRLSTEEILALLKSAKFNVEKSDIISGAQIAINYLKKENISHIFGLCTNSFAGELKEAGIKVSQITDTPSTKAELVTLDKTIKAAVFCEDFNYNFVGASLSTRYIFEEKCKFICVGMDRQFPWENGEFIPGAYTLSAATETATYLQPTIIGKPNSETFSDLLPFKKGDDVVVIGDNQETDIAFANEMGFKSVLLLTGVTDTHEITEENKPTIVCKDFKELTEKISTL